MNDDLKQLTALTALNHMLASDYFSICTIDTVGKLLNKPVKCDAYNALHALHCIHYSKMPKELREEIPKLIEECLGFDPVFQFKTIERQVIDINPLADEKKPTLLLRLFGKATPQ